MNKSQSLAGGLTALAAIALTACGGGGSGDLVHVSPATPPAEIVISDAATRCTGLSGATVAAADIGLPTRGASVTSATLVAAASAVPEYCRLLGEVAATNAGDPPIKFQLNLPSKWNVKSMQFGGGGFNGFVVSGLDTVTQSPTSAATPLARGYVTFGSDSGNQDPSGGYGTNAQALANYGGEAVKRARDVAVAFMKRYYSSQPWKQYYSGGSKGGHEALVAAQRYGAEFDGVIAYYPANQNQAMTISWYRLWQAAYQTPGGYLNPVKQALLKTKVMEACDALDGLADGLVGNTKACDLTFAPNSLRCVGGADTGNTCLSDAQLNATVAAASPTRFAFPFANGVTEMQPYPVFQGGDLGVWLDATGTGTSTSYYGFANSVVRFFIQQDRASSLTAFNYLDWQPRVQYLSNLLDATDPRLEAFRDHGGKMLLVQGTTDMLVTHNTTTAYFERLMSRFGTTLPQFARYYVVPGYGHADGTFRSTWDSLTALEEWAERGNAPANQVTVDANPATLGRSRPLCEYPAFPKYKGAGDTSAASNFTCSTS